MTEINHSVVNLTWRDGIRVNVIPVCGQIEKDLPLSSEYDDLVT